MVLYKRVIDITKKKLYNNHIKTIYIKELMQNKKKRNSSIELLRILCMLMVVASHYVCGRANNSIPFNSGQNLVNSIIFCLLGQWGRVGVIIFVMISAFFLVDSKFNFKRILKLVLQVFFYSVVLFVCVDLIYTKSKFTFYGLFRACFPILTQTYWFITPYLLMSLLSPFLNVLIKHIGQKRHLALTLTLFLFATIFPNISLDRFPIPFTYLGLFIAIYFLMAYIKIYPISILESFKKTFIVFLVLSLIIVGWTVGWLCMATKVQIFETGIAYSTYLTRINNVVGILFSLFLFNLFRFIKIKSNAFINVVAGGTFGVYIIHCSPYVSSIIWLDIFNVFKYTYSNPLLALGHYVGVVLVVFFACVIIDIIRKYLLEIPFFKIIDKPYNKIEGFLVNKFNNVIDKQNKKQDKDE